MAISYRPITPEDDPVLFEVYASTRREDLSAEQHSQEQTESFLRLQFSAQQNYYRQQAPDAEFLLVLQDDQPIGRLYLDRRKTEIRVLDIALLPQHRGQGTGGQIMRDILAEAQTKRLPIRIQVEHNNPAIHLFDRLGFRKLEDAGISYLMEWRPAANSK